MEHLNIPLKRNIFFSQTNKIKENDAVYEKKVSNDALQIQVCDQATTSNRKFKKIQQWYQCRKANMSLEWSSNLGHK